MLEQLVEVGGVRGEADDVGERHVGGGQDVLQVVEGHLELRGHVARMLRVAVGVHRVLSAAEQLSLVRLTSWAWSKPSWTDQDEGLIAVLFMVCLLCLSFSG